MARRTWSGAGYRVRLRVGPSSGAGPRGGAGGVSSNASVGPHVRALAACGGRAPDQIRDKEGRRRRLKVGG